MNLCLFIGRKNKIVFVYKALFSAFSLWHLKIMDIWILYRSSSDRARQAGITLFACKVHAQLSDECVWFPLKQCEPRQNYSTFPIFPQHMAVSLTTTEFSLGLLMSSPLDAGQTQLPSAVEKGLLPKLLNIDIHWPTLQTHFSQQTQTSLPIAVLHLHPGF